MLSPKLLITLLLSLWSCKHTTPDEIESPYQRLIVIVGDDHSFTALGAYGNDYIQTPNLDRLAKEGVMFRKAYATSPICSASRQSLLTGKYPHATGVNLLFTPFEDEGNVTIAEHLKSKGFQTSVIGKTHFNNWLWGPLYKEGLPDHGFDKNIGKARYKEWLKAQSPQTIEEGIKTRENQIGKGIPWQKNADMLPTGKRSAETEAAFFVNQAIETLSISPDQAQLIWLAFHEPHAPFNYPIEYQNTYHPDSVKLPLGSPEDERWIPEIFKGLSEEQKRGIITSYYRSVTHLDHQVGRLLEGLKTQGLLKETLIVYLGDQGYLLNDHRRFEKHSFWEEAVRAPLILWGKDLPQGKVIEQAVSFVDLAPTLCEYLRIERHQDFQGKSLKSLIEGNESISNDYIFSEFLQDNKAMVASKRWKYIFTSGSRDLTLSYATGYGPSGIYHRLYDLEADPEERHNLAYESEMQDRVLDLQGLMLDFFERTHPETDRCPNNLTDVGKLVWYCEPRDLGGDYQERPARVFEGKVYEPVDN